MEQFPKKMLKKLPNVLVEEFPRIFGLPPDGILKITSGQATSEGFSKTISGKFIFVEFLHAGGIPELLQEFP